MNITIVGLNLNFAVVWEDWNKNVDKFEYSPAVHFKVDGFEWGGVVNFKVVNKESNRKDKFRMPKKAKKQAKIAKSSDSDEGDDLKMFWIVIWIRTR